MKTALITGINGFVGTHLTRHLLDAGYKIIGIDRQEADPARLQEAFGKGVDLQNVKLIANDLSDIPFLETIFQDHTIDEVYHLAGIAFVPEGWKNPAGILKVNTLNTVNLLQAARESGWRGRFIFVSSSDIYGNPGLEKMPITENTAVMPTSPYAASKIAAEYFALTFCQSGLEVIVARPFNHIGPGQAEQFVVPSFLKKVLAIKAGNGKELTVGDLKSVRDFTDVRDVVHAYRILAEKGQAGETYNICTGKEVEIGEVLNIIQKITETSLEYKVDESLLRPDGSDKRYGSALKLEALGWSPLYSLEDSIRAAHELLIK